MNGDVPDAEVGATYPPSGCPVCPVCHGGWRVDVLKNSWMVCHEHKTMFDGLCRMSSAWHDHGPIHSVAAILILSEYEHVAAYDAEDPDADARQVYADFCETQFRQLPEEIREGWRRHAAKLKDEQAARRASKENAGVPF